MAIYLFPFYSRYHWIQNATAYNHAYMDSGIFCIHGSADPSQLRDLVEVIIRELVNTQHAIAKVNKVFLSTLIFSN